MIASPCDDLCDYWDLPEEEDEYEYDPGEDEAWLHDTKVPIGDEQ